MLKTGLLRAPVQRMCKASHLRALDRFLAPAFAVTDVLQMSFDKHMWGNTPALAEILGCDDTMCGAAAQLRLVFSGSTPQQSPLNRTAPRAV